MSITFIPFDPVCAFALPELTIKALAFPLLFFLSQMIGEDGVDVLEYTFAQFTTSSKLLLKDHQIVF